MGEPFEDDPVTLTAFGVETAALYIAKRRAEACPDRPLGPVALQHGIASDISAADGGAAVPHDRRAAEDTHHFGRKADIGGRGRAAVYYLRPSFGRPEGHHHARYELRGYHPAQVIFPRGHQAMDMKGVPLQLICKAPAAAQLFIGAHRALHEPPLTVK